MSAAPLEPERAGRPNLRERQRTELRRALRVEAHRLFAERGYDAVTMDDVAAAAGVSLSTAFRHAASKEQLLVGPAHLGPAMILRNLRARPVDEPVEVALARAFLDHVAAYAEEGEQTQTWRAAMARAPLRLRRASLLDHADRAVLVGIVADRMGVPAASDVRPSALVAVVTAASEAAFEHWLTEPDGPPLLERTRAAMSTAGLPTGAAR